MTPIRRLLSAWLERLRPSQVVHCYCGATFKRGEPHLCPTPGQIEVADALVERCAARARGELPELPAPPVGPVCIGGWLYSPVGGMVFPTNRQCPGCSDCKPR